MKALIFVVSYLLFCNGCIRAQLRTVCIETVHHEEPTCDFVEAPEGSMGASVINATKVPCRVVIKQSQDTLYDSGDYEKSVSGATIKITGNTTAYYSIYENFPYKLKLQKKADLLLRNAKEYADKDWRLLKDAITLNTIIGLKISQLLGFPWTPAYTPCQVYLNGDYRGCYLLIESVERNNDCRLRVDKETGYIVEKDPYWWKEDQYFATNYFANDKGYRWTWKYPDEDDVTPEQEDYIRQYINQAEQSIANGNYEPYIDIRSFARWVLAHDILGTRDSGGSNLFVSKYDNTDSTRLEMPCLWDFDSNFDVTPGAFSNIHLRAYDYYFDHLFNNSNKAFVKAYQQLWNEVRETLLEDISQFIVSYVDSDEGKALQQARQQYIERWDHWRKVTMQEDAQTAVEWFDSHLPLLDKNIQRLDVTSSISPLTGSKTEPLYNLYGQKMTERSTLRKGIYVKGNKKIIIRN